MLQEQEKMQGSNTSNTADQEEGDSEDILVGLRGLI